MTPEPLSFDPIAEAQRQWDQRWGHNLTMGAATSIMRAGQIVLAAVDGALRPLGLTFARWEALILLSFVSDGSLSLGKIGKRLMIHPTSVTNIVDRLEKEGLVTRTAHPSDGRTVLATITPKGRRLAAKGTAAVEGGQFGLDPLGDDELKQITEVLRHLRAAKGDFETSDWNRDRDDAVAT